MIHNVMRKKDDDEISSVEGTGQETAPDRRKRDPDKRWLDAAMRGVQLCFDREETGAFPYDGDEDREVYRSLRQDERARSYKYNRWPEA